MPIANCIVSPSRCSQAGDADGLVVLWARESGKSPEHMTVNIVERRAQVGSAYEVMATLWLPSLWSQADVDSLQVGLARALAAHFGVGLGSVHIITRIIEPGLVVEDGETLSW